MKYTIELITADVPTENGRIYSKECLEKMCKQVNESNNTIPLVVGYDPVQHINSPKIDMSTFVGTVKNASVTKMNQIKIDLKFLKTPKNHRNTNDVNLGVKLLDSGCATITPVIRAEFDENHKVIEKDLKVLHFAIVLIAKVPKI